MPIDDSIFSHELMSVNICGKSVDLLQFLSISKKIAFGICSLLNSSLPLLFVAGICQEPSIIFTFERFFSSHSVDISDIRNFFPNISDDNLRLCYNFLILIFW